MKKNGLRSKRSIISMLVGLLLLFVTTTAMISRPTVKASPNKTERALPEVPNQIKFTQILSYSYIYL